MERILGLDGGGTKTDVALVDAGGRVHLRLRRGGLDPTGAGDWEKALADIAAGVGSPRAAVLGLPYHGEIAAVSTRQIALGHELFGAQTLVLNDVEVAFDGALAGAEGVLVLAGTGSMAWSHGPQGTHRVGGWGDVFGDEGSAFWIGRQALARVSQELDGRRPGDGFAAALLSRIGVEGPGLMTWVYGLADQRAGIAGLALQVSALALAGQPGAQALMAEAGAELARHAGAALRLSGAAPTWSFAGGVMADAGIRAAVTAQLGQPPLLPRLPPVGGAVLRAARLAGWPVTESFLARLCQDLAQDHQAATGRGAGGRDEQT